MSCLSSTYLGQFVGHGQEKSRDQHLADTFAKSPEGHCPKVAVKGRETKWTQQHEEVVMFYTALGIPSPE